MVVCPICRAKYPEGTQACPEDGSALLPEEAFAAAEAKIEPGTMIGEYRVERKLGEGSFGAVYAGVQPLIGKRVAVKVLHKRMSSEPEVVARFIGEARAVNRIGHRNIIDVFSFGVHGEGQHYFVMELCDGLTLGELLHREKRLGVEAALPILRGIADGLDAAHAAGVTHRDLKPDNVFLVREKDGSYFPKLLDFGVAKLVADDAAQKTATGVAIGTPRYMSPEQSRGKKVDHRADIYSLGAVAHEMLTGAHLFEADSTVDLLFKHATEAPPPMSSVCRDLPPELDAPVLAMLAKRPAARPASAGEAIEALAAKARESGAHKAAAKEALAEGAAVSAFADTVQAVVALPDAEQKDKAEGNELSLAEAPTVAVRAEPGTGTVEMPVTPTGTVLGEPPVKAQVLATSTVPALSAAIPEPVVAVPSPHTPPARRSPSPRTIIVVLGVVGMGFMVATYLSRSRQGGERAPAASAIASATAVAPTAEPTTVTIRFAVMPASARVLLDGRDMGPASEPLVIERGKTDRAVQIRHDGYEAQTMWIKPDEDKALGPISLRALPEAPAASSAPAKGSASPAKAPTKPLNKALEMPKELGGK